MLPKCLCRQWLMKKHSCSAVFFKCTNAQDNAQIYIPVYQRQKNPKVRYGFWYLASFEWREIRILH